MGAGIIHGKNGGHDDQNLLNFIFYIFSHVLECLGRARRCLQVQIDNSDN